MTPTSLGVTIGAIVACAWGLAGATALTGRWRTRMVLIVLMACAGIGARAIATPLPPGIFANFHTGPYAWALALGLVAGGAAVWALRAPAHRAYIAPALALIMGLHFIGLWAATGQRLALGLTCGLCAAAAITVGWPRAVGGVDPRTAIAGFGAAFVIWAGCLSALI